MTEKEKFLNYVREQQAKGLHDMGFFVNPDAGTATEEEIYGELNRMVNAPDVPDKEVLGNFDFH